MEQVEVINQKGEVVKNFPLSSPLWQVPLSRWNVSLANRYYLFNQRQATSKTLSRGEVKGSTRKIYRQKGTGGARHGARYAPQFRGGGVAFGPTGEKSGSLKINQKFKKKVLYSIIGEKLQQKQVRVIEKINLPSPKTKEANKLLGILAPQKSNILLILTPEEKNDQTIIRSFRNLPAINKISDSQSLSFGE